MEKQTLLIDIAIIGGGIAGLWALRQLRQAGYSAALFEHRELGSQQTIASQGIIHSGVKYSLSGIAASLVSEDSQTMAAMPTAWRDCLAGEGSLDLQGCELLSEHVYLWSTDRLSAKVAAFFASKALHGDVTGLSRSEFPTAFQAPEFRGNVYRLNDFVIDVSSLLQTLVAQEQAAIFSIDWNKTCLETVAGRAQLELPHCTIKPKQLILAAGAGNQALLAALGVQSPAMQLRPLQQVMVKHHNPHPVFAHCVGNGPAPRLTISSHRTAAGDPVWYLGGDLATDGASADPQALIATAQAELSRLLPWINLGDAQWRTLQLDRAELGQASLLRPDRAYVGQPEALNNVRVLWPSKLSLCPDMGAELERQLHTDNIRPQHPDDTRLLEVMGRPEIAQPAWEKLFQ